MAESIFRHAQGRVDAPLLGSAALLLVVGLAVLTSASSTLSQEQFGHPWGFTARQLLFGVGGGGVLLFFGQKISYRVWKSFALPFLLGTALLLFAVFIPEISYEAGGASRWVSIGGFTFQPSELIKVSLIMYLAAWLSARNRKGISAQEGLLPFLAIVGIIGMLLVMQPDLSTFGVLALTATILYFVSGTPLWHTGAIFMVGAGLLAFLIRIAPYRFNRILSFINPGLDPQGIGYQIHQALLAIGSGGLFGRGIGFSRQKFFYLPEPIGDSIFAIMAEETGFAGVTLLLALFVFFAWRGFTIARNAPDDFGRLLAFGLTAWIIIQALLNIAGNLQLGPITGITLPFVSYGSSSLAVTLFSVGILLNISRHGKARQRPRHAHES